MSEFSSEPSLWLTQTKLVPPRLRDDYIPRARLLSLLANSVTNHPLTLVSRGQQPGHRRVVCP